MLSPNTRKRKSRMADEIVAMIKDFEISKNDEMDVVTLAIKKLRLYDQIKFTSKPSVAGRKLTSLFTRQAVWKFWHEVSKASTITSRAAKIYVKNTPKIQSGLDYVDTVRIIQQRNRNLYESQWFVTKETLKVLYHKFLKINQESSVSYGTFLGLKSFCVRSATTKDIEICCCKKHLHI